MNNFLIIGAGFSGAVIAERLVNSLDCRVLVIDERQHIGGNCHTARDESTGVMVHTYGPHIFNTDNEEVWNYLQQFGEFVPFVYRVKAVHNGQVYSLPVNLHTINQLFGKSFNPKEAEAFIASVADNTIAEPKNFEEQALKFLGEKLYRAFFYGYTKKQWGCEPRELPASILKRLPVRFNYNDNYYSNHIQAMPRDGYTAIFESMLTHPNIEVKLNTKFDDSFDTNGFEHIFYSGPIDAFFKYKHGRLSYRTVSFERNEGTGDFQGNAQINYTDESVPFTRIVEHKHFTPWEQHEKTVYFKEYSKETEADDVPFYPKRLSADMEKLKLYQQELAALPNYTFLGRLATYRYMDMHHVIAEALQKAKEFIEQYKLELWPK
jgi:UDP-galactopyranose mutase